MVKKRQQAIYTERDDRLILRVKARPGAGRTTVVEFLNGELIVKIKAAARKGKANAELVSYISKILGTPKSEIEIVSGAKSRHKTLAVDPSCRQALNRLGQTLLPD